MWYYDIIRRHLCTVSDLKLFNRVKHVYVILPFGVVAIGVVGTVEPGIAREIKLRLN